MPSRPLRRRLLLVNGLTAVLLMRFGLIIFKLHRLRRILPEASGIAPAELLAETGRAVTRAARLLGGANCLVQALAAQCLLARAGYGSELRLGARRRPDGAFEAHAWLVSGGHAVVGGDEQILSLYSPFSAQGQTGR